MDFNREVQNYITKINSAIVQGQEDIIVQTIQRVADQTNILITVDKDLTYDMLSKYLAKKPKETDAFPHRVYCPTCYNTFAYNCSYMKVHEYVNFCPCCGQRIDWGDYVEITPNGEKIIRNKGEKEND